MVSHETLLLKLYNYEICDVVYNLVKSYLNYRQQTVSINQTHSTLKNITYGVPQGSSLGPLFFLISAMLSVVFPDNLLRTQVY